MTQQQIREQAAQQADVHSIEAQLSRAVVAELHQQDIVATVLDFHIDRDGSRAEARVTGARYKKDARGLTRRTPIDGRLLMEADPARPNRWQVRGEDALRDVQFTVVLGLDAARHVMEQFLDAVRAGDPEKMKTLSLGSVNGWLDREQAQRLRATHLSGIYLPAMTKMLENLQKNVFAGRLERIRLGVFSVDTAVRDDWAGTQMSTGVGEDRLVLIFRDTSQGWRFVHWDIVKTPWQETIGRPLAEIIDEFVKDTEPILAEAKKASSDMELREVALRFLTAVHDKDLPAMMNLSLGAVEGWMSDQRAAAAAQQRERILPGLHATTLERVSRAILVEVFDRDLAALTNIQETAVVGDFAAVRVPFPLKNPKQAIFIFKKTPQGWRFLADEIGQGPLDVELRRDVPKYEQILRGVTPPVPKPGKESAEKGPEAARADPLKSTRADQMRAIILAGLEFAMDHPDWPAKLDELKPRYLDANKIVLGQFVYHPPGRQSPAKNPQEVAVLAEKEPAFAGGQLVGFADGYVAFIRDPEQLKRLLPAEAESSQPSNGKKEAK